MGCDQNIHEWSEPWTPWMTIFLFFVILSEQLVNSWVISGIERVQDFTIQNWSETWFCKMLKTAYECEFSVNVIWLTHHLSISRLRYITLILHGPKIEHFLGYPEYYKFFCYSMIRSLYIFYKEKLLVLDWFKVHTNNWKSRIQQIEIISLLFSEIMCKYNLKELLCNYFFQMQ